MKIEKLQLIFPEPALCSAIVGDLPITGEFKQDELCLQIKMADLVEKALESLEASLARGIHKGTC